MLKYFSITASELKTKWTESTFPFTQPSWELEIEYKGHWFEVLGCGILRQEILENGNYLCQGLFPGLDMLVNVCVILKLEPRTT